MSTKQPTAQDPVRDTPSGQPAGASKPASDEGATSCDTAPAETGAATKHPIPKKALFFGACAVIAILVYAIANSQNLAQVFVTIGDILAPITIGGVIAYLCNPIMRFYEYIVFGRMKKSALHQGLSLLMTVLTVFGLLAGLLALILPELINSVSHLIDNAPAYLTSLLGFLNDIVQKVTANMPVEIDISTPDRLIEFLNEYIGSMDEIRDKVMAAIGDFNLAGGVWKFIVDVFVALKNLFLGMFIAFYILASKEKRSAQINKARAALLNEKQNQKLTEFVKLVDKTFGGFIKGLLLDALAVGAVTFLLLTIFRVSEYNLLIAAICAVTNIIPVFGPFIGAIPSALIVLISNPSKLLVFLILILVIQQIDGNILVPRIQGSNTGISSLAVLVAITIMGSLFGIMGMVIGVPIFAVIIEMVKRALEDRLRKRGLATDTVAYYPSDSIGNAEEEVYYEHSHLRYWYAHSKLKVNIDRLRARVAKMRGKREEKRLQKGKASKKKTGSVKSKSVKPPKTPPHGEKNTSGSNTDTDTDDI